MTALPQYERLEAPGIWRESPEAQRQEVIVSFGDATLVIADDRSVKALAHWSLPALVRRNPGKLPAIYAPSDEPGEELEIDDETMVEAIERVHSILESRRPHPGRLRGWLTGGTLALAGLLAVFWLPGALIAQAARVAPQAKRVEIGHQVLAELTTLTGMPCSTGQGRRALNALRTRLAGPEEIVVLPQALKGARRLPGKVVAIGRDTISGLDTPEVAAGHIIAAELASAGEDPLLTLLEWAGASAAFRLLTTGDLPDSALRGYGQVLLANPPAMPDTDSLLAAFAQAGVSSTPYAYSLDPSGESVLSVIEADPFKGAPAPRPVLDDAQWIALREICD
ncbi:hypothetical protein [Sedimentimonas flavescens]|uniref:hypothetical protein n=1 Tax=Sedimentimonas flavescens TaxID=2851012 RepID=UPI001C49FD04|nr:hypothetical protein [Sedimentimonas flavescens]MBW0156747.1 hypothetical protein [Sedimentimonas flavescens]